LKRKTGEKRAGKKRRSCGQESSAWVSSYGEELREREDGAKEASARVADDFKALKKDYQVYGQKLAETAKQHLSEAFYGLDDLFSQIGYPNLKAICSLVIQVRIFFIEHYTDIDRVKGDQVLIRPN
jgi:hypothetical protein